MNIYFKIPTRASLVAQWLRICLPMQGTRVWALGWEDPTCHGATKPVHHNYWACALEPASHNHWAHMPQLLKPARLEPVLCNKRSPRTATKSSPHSPQREKSPCTTTKTQRSQEKKNPTRGWWLPTFIKKNDTSCDSPVVSSHALCTCRHFCATVV